MEIERELLDKEYIIEMISNKKDSGFARTTIKLLGLELRTALFFGVVAFLLTIGVLFGLEFLKFIKKYETTV